MNEQAKVKKVEHIEEGRNHVLDTEHLSRRAGTLVVGPQYDRSTLLQHHIDNVEMGAFEDLKRTPEGKIILIPQPTDYPEQPLNWSWKKKHSVLLVLVYCTLMSDLTSVWTIPLVPVQAEYWHISANNAGRNLSGNIFMLGVGSLLAVPVTRWLGRLPVLFWCMILSFLMTVFSVTTADWIPFIVARLQGLFITTPQVVGLIIIHDMFFFHEHARKIGIWAATFIISPYAGPFLAGIVVTYRSWRVAQWVNAALLGFGLILVSLFGEETYWDPAKSDNHSANLSPNESWLIVRLKSLTGFSRSRAQDGDVLQSIYGLGFLFCRPHWLALCVFYLSTFMWSIGMNTTLGLFLEPPPPQGFGFSGLNVALIFLGPMVAAIIGELFGQWFNDFIANRHIRKSHGMYEPEVRLWTTWISTAFLIAALSFFGHALETQMPWIAVVVAWSMFAFGIVLQTVAITAYGLDVFPDQAVEAAAIINFFRTSGGFIVNYFQVSWAEAVGSSTTFGIQAGIVGGAFCLILLVQVLESTMRERFPSLAVKRQS